MSHAPNTIEVKLTIHYYGLKATQYFSKMSPESESVFLDDLFTLKLPHPKRGNTTLISFGRMQCIWPEVQKNGVLHKHIKMRVDPIPDIRPSTQEHLADLSIANITAKFRDLRSSEIDQVSFKRSYKDVEDPAQDDRPSKKKKFEQDPTEIRAPTSLSTTKRISPVKTKSAVNTASKPPLAPRIMPDWLKTPHQPSRSLDSSSTSQHDSTPSRRYTTNDERITSDVNHAASEFLNSINMPKGLPNREHSSRGVKQEKIDQLKAPQSSAPAAIQSSTTLPIQSTPSNPSTSTALPRPSSMSLSLPARPNSNPPLLSASSAESPVRRISRFGPGPAAPTRYSPHTLAAFAKEYTKIERISPEPFTRAPSPPPPSHPPTQPPPSTTSSLSRPADVMSTASSVDSTFSSLKSTAITAVSSSTFKPFKLSTREERRGSNGKEVPRMRGWGEEAPSARDHSTGQAVAGAPASLNQNHNAATDARDSRLKTTATPRQGSGTGVVRDVEMREPQRALAAPPLASSGSMLNGRQGSTGSGSGNTSASARGDEYALAELRGRLVKMETELTEERRRRQVAEDAIADIRRECRAPFIVPSLVDAFMELSRMTTIATTPTGSLVSRSSSNNQKNDHPTQNTTLNHATVVNGSAPARRASNVEAAARPLPPRSADSYAAQNAMRMNVQWPGSSMLPPQVFVKTSHTQAPVTVRVKEEPVEMSWG